MTAHEPVFIPFADIRTIIQSHFTMIDAYMDPSGIPTFRVSKEMPVKDRFKTLLRDLAVIQWSAAIRSPPGVDGFVIQAFQRVERPSHARPLLNLVLMFATVGTILYAGYTTVHSLDEQILSTVFRGSNLDVQVVMFAAALFGIIALHETGHKLASNAHNMDSSMPYFIPGLPPLGTFGAVVSLRTPPTNRDELFDLGFAGPAVGFVVTVVVAVVSILAAPLISQTQLAKFVEQGLVYSQTWPNVPLLMVILNSIGIRTLHVGQALFPTQVTFAAEIGALLTFINLIPVWQLDGGHIFGAVLGQRGHRIASFVGLAILLLAGYWAFAILLTLLMSGRGRSEVRPLDDVSPLSNSRKALFVLALVMIVLCFITI